MILWLPFSLCLLQTCPPWDFRYYFFLPAAFWDKGGTTCCIYFSYSGLTRSTTAGKFWPSSAHSSGFAVQTRQQESFLAFFILCLKYGSLFLSIARHSIAHLLPWILFGRRGKAHVFTLHFSPHASFLPHLDLQWVTVI